MTELLNRIFEIACVGGGAELIILVTPIGT